ncbi:MAG: magnesium transporter CorA family protein, partial [bacterium]
LAYQILDRAMDRYHPMLDELEGKIDEMEDMVFVDSSKTPIPELIQMRHVLLTLRRNAIYNREVFNVLARHDSEFITGDVGRYYRDLYDHLTLFVDQIENQRDQLVGVMEAYLSQTSNRLNEIMKFLTVFSTLFIPLNFVVGFFGTNFENLPFIKTPYGWLLMTLTMVFLLLGGMSYFARKKWM